MSALNTRYSMSLFMYGMSQNFKIIIFFTQVKIDREDLMN